MTRLISCLLFLAVNLLQLVRSQEHRQLWSHLQPKQADQHVLDSALISKLPGKHVAIIGAGSAGASSAYYLNQYATAAGVPLSITVYERSDYIGGRSTTVNAFDNASQPIELGASIFVEVNHNLVSAVKAFNLSLADDGDDDVEERLGIWNGQEFVWIQTLGLNSRWKSWWQNARLLYRYGLAPIRTLKLMKSTVGKFLKLYEAPHFPFRDLSQAAYDVGLTGVTAVTGVHFLGENGIGEKFAKEIVQAATRVNYAQNLGQIHGLEAMVCMAADGAMAVEGGNWRIFESMLNASAAEVRLRSEVREVVRREDGGFSVHSKRTTGSMETDSMVSREDYDAVILAAPYQFSAINITPPPKRIPDSIDYVNLHTTLFSTSHNLSPSFFGLPDTAAVPDAILTTLQPAELDTAGAGHAGFFSISKVARAVNSGTGRYETVYKIFSPQNITSAFLHKLLGMPALDDQAESTTVTWIYRKLWQSYPYLPPRITFEELMLEEGLWYTSGIESFISTMETSSLMGKNVARLVVNGWMAGG